MNYLAQVAAVLPAPASAAEMPTHERIEGCASDANGRPLALAAHAGAVDGQLLATAPTQTDGVVRTRGPAQHAVRFAAATPGAEPLTLLSGTTALAVTGCLRLAV
jgi:hypothetical protein